MQSIGLNTKESASADEQGSEYLYQCEDCEWAGTSADLDGITDVHDRVLEGELMASGCCPECGSMIGVPDCAIPNYTLESVARVMRARGWAVTEPNA